MYKNIMCYYNTGESLELKMTTEDLRVEYVLVNELLSFRSDVRVISQEFGNFDLGESPS